MREVANHLPGRLELCRITPLLVKNCFAVIYNFRSISILPNTFSRAESAKHSLTQGVKRHSYTDLGRDLQQQELPATSCLKPSIVRREIKSQEATREKQISGAKGKTAESLLN